MLKKSNKDSNLYVIVIKSLVKNLSENFIINGITVYFTLILLLNQAIVEQLNKIQNDLDSLKIDMKFIHYTLESLILFCKEFDRIFSLLPLIWFGINFLLSSGVVFYLIHGKNTYDMTATFAYASLDNLTVVSMVIVISWERNRVVEACHEIRKKLSLVYMTENTSIMSLSVFHSLDTLSKIKMSAMGFFVLDNKLLLSFVAAVISFAILFVSTN